MGNLDYYDKLKAVPKEALKQIMAGRLKGMSDINPMWRIKVMTETFGVCGIGWKYEIIKQWTETFGNEIKGFCNINLYIKDGDKWSDPIPGTGGSSFVTFEKKGAYVNDEVYKMALTDALSVAMKALGVGADVYSSKAETKYAYNEQAATGQLPVQDNSFILTLQNIKECRNIDELENIWNECYAYQKDKTFISAVTNKKKILLNG